jgi:hypothetical protein
VCPFVDVEIEEVVDNTSSTKSKTIPTVQSTINGFTLENMSA